MSDLRRGSVRKRTIIYLLIHFAELDALALLWGQEVIEHLLTSKQVVVATNDKNIQPGSSPGFILCCNETRQDLGQNFGCLQRRALPTRAIFPIQKTIQMTAKNEQKRP
jgi:hypothetical protein